MEKHTSSMSTSGDSSPSTPSSAPRGLSKPLISLPLIDKFQALYFDEYIHLEQAKNGDFYLTHEIDDDTLREEIWIARNCLATEVPITIYMNSHGAVSYTHLTLPTTPYV